MSTRCVYQKGNKTYSEGEAEKVVVIDMAYLELHVPLVRNRLQQVLESPSASRRSWLLYRVFVWAECRAPRDFGRTPR